MDGDERAAVLLEQGRYGELLGAAGRRVFDQPVRLNQHERDIAKRRESAI